MENAPPQKSETQPPAYIGAILACLAEHPPQPGSLIEVDVGHDAWCPLLLGQGACCCLPDIVVQRVGKPGGNG
ncbi:MAG: hypothetical protein LAO05_06165 [Acidobacteriia bacterium]|nr:hypothetical protein [Terriglobia bacterium]